MRPNNVYHAFQYGISLLEFVIVLVCFGIIGAALVPMMGSEIKAYESIVNDSLKVSSSEVAMMRLRKDFQDVTQLVKIRPERLRFVNSAGTDIDYTLGNDNILYRNGQPLLLNVALNNSNFTYLDASQQVTSNNDLAFIHVRLTTAANNEQVLEEALLALPTAANTVVIAVGATQP